MKQSLPDNSSHFSAQLNSGNSLINLEPGGSKRPFFLIHNDSGETAIYRDLARYLGLDRPIYGLQLQRKQGYPILHTRMTEAIAHYSQIIQEVQPIGPYILGGSGFGGVLAVEIAQYLYACGNSVVLVALFDSLNGGASRASEEPRANARANSHAPDLAILKAIAQTGKSIGARVGNKLKVQLYRYYLERNKPLPQYLQTIPISTILSVAWQEYRSQVFHGEISLYRAKNGVGRDRPTRNRTPDPLFGWGKQAIFGIELHDIPGGHESILQEPNVQILVRKLNASLFVALPDESASATL